MLGGERSEEGGRPLGEAAALSAWIPPGGSRWVAEESGARADAKPGLRRRAAASGAVLGRAPGPRRCECGAHIGILVRGASVVTAGVVAIATQRKSDRAGAVPTALAIISALAPQVCTPERRLRRGPGPLAQRELIVRGERKGPKRKEGSYLSF